MSVSSEICSVKRPFRRKSVHVRFVGNQCMSVSSGKFRGRFVGNQLDGLQPEIVRIELIDHGRIGFEGFRTTSVFCIMPELRRSEFSNFLRSGLQRTATPYRSDPPHVKPGAHRPGARATLPCFPPGQYFFLRCWGLLFFPRLNLLYGRTVGVFTADVVESSGSRVVVSFPAKTRHSSHLDPIVPRYSRGGLVEAVTASLVLTTVIVGVLFVIWLVFVIVRAMIMSIFEDDSPMPLMMGESEPSTEAKKGDSKPSEAKKEQ